MFVTHKQSHVNGTISMIKQKKDAARANRQFVKQNLEQVKGARFSARETAKSKFITHTMNTFVNLNLKKCDY